MSRLIRAVQPVPAELCRAVSVLVLLAIAAIGLRARAEFSSAGLPAAKTITDHAFLAVFGTVEGLGAVACVALFVLVFRGLVITGGARCGNLWDGM
jgi:hypothetical protein